MSLTRAWARLAVAATCRWLGCSHMVLSCSRRVLLGGRLELHPCCCCAGPSCHSPWRYLGGCKSLLAAAATRCRLGRSRCASFASLLCTQQAGSRLRDLRALLLCCAWSRTSSCHDAVGHLCAYLGCALPLCRRGGSTDCVRLRGKL